MKSKIVYFEDTNHSWKGTLRGGVASLILLSNFAIYKTYGKVIKFMPVCIAVIIILIASAISIQNPSTLKEAVVYGALVGLVTFGSMNMGLLMSKSGGWTRKDALIAIGVGVISSALASAVIFYIKPLAY